MMFKLLRTKSFDNTKCKFVPMFLNEDYEPIEAKWCWSVLEDDLSAFLEEYSDVPWEIVNPTEHVYAVDYKLFDNIVCGYVDIPETIQIFPFDPEKHSLRKLTIIDDDYNDVYEYFDNPFAVIVCNDVPETLALVPRDKDLYWWNGELIRLIPTPKTQGGVRDE